MTKAIQRVAAFAAIFLAISVLPGAAQDKRRQNGPGQFDFYVLSLSWSPLLCDYVSERSPASAEVDQRACKREQVVMPRMHVRGG